MFQTNEGQVIDIFSPLRAISEAATVQIREANASDISSINVASI
jgi:hypothetical protein